MCERGLRNQRPRVASQLNNVDDVLAQVHLIDVVGVSQVEPLQQDSRETFY